ncbi:MAG: glycine cleavage system protein GcvH [Kofleriaceae bacterium]|nr:glycine cleavage system protein GcvH [Kofleriaceae bacterium]
MADIIDDLLYTKEHEWLRAMDGGSYQVGVSAFAVEQLGDVTMVELPQVGDTLDKEQVFGTVESVKAVSDLFAPISGEITKINESLEDAPEAVNDAPYTDGWLVEIVPNNAAEIDELMSAEAYKSFCAED